ncbi:MAG TPA: choice-of-anchor N protein [Casimicrobiaceae bacterium]|nr:choice-of-anchor N protein [Casimicrobiaceae bacterium]
MPSLDHAKIQRFVRSIAPAAAFAAGLVGAGSAYAVPELQLTIPGGSYDTVTETTIAGGQTFDLYALFDQPKKGDDLSTTFYISFALMLADGDLVASSPFDAGSFKFNNTTYNVTSDLTWGTPGALPVHSAFPTWYGVLPFHFSSSDQTTSFNTQTTTPSSISGGCTSNCLFFSDFAVDTSLLSSNYLVHFDLFDSAMYGGDHSGSKAPFSHDAQSLCSTQGPCTPRRDVPEPATLALMVAGLAGLAATRRRRR